MKRLYPYLTIAVLCIAAYWQVAFLVDTLKYDILDGYLPGHSFVSECLRNNVFPLWNPYQQLGTPIYADLLNTNYLIDMFTGRLFPYTNITYHVFFILYLIIAGAGAYKLAGRLKISNQFRLLISIAYPLSGFFTGNAQHIQFIISAAWLPLSLYYFLRLATEISLRNMLLFVIFTILLITGGYPSIAVMQACILVILFMYFLITFLKQKKYHQIFSFVLYCLAASGLLLILSSGILTGIGQSTPQVSRFVKLTYDFSITNPFTPESLISLISPLVPAAHPALFRTDVSMNNHYFGVIIFIFFIYALFRRQNFVSAGILSAGVIMLLISFGDHFFIHRVLYEHFPLFNKFRHPSAFRVFSILFFLVYAGIQVSRYDPAKDDNFRLFRKIYLGFLFALLLICMATAGVMAYRMLGPTDFKPTISGLISDYGIFGPLFLQTAIMLIINSLFVYFILIRKKSHLFYQIVLLMLVAELLIFTQLNQYYTVIYKHNPLEISKFLNSRPSGFPLPDHHLISENTDQSVSCFPLLHNTNTYAKTVSSEVSKYPFSLDGYTTLRNDSLLFNHSVRNTLLYFGDSILSLAQRNKINYSVFKGEKKIVFVEDSVYQRHGKEFNNSAEPGDTLVCHYFSPSRIGFTTSSASTRVAVLLQNNYPGWKVYTDGKETDHFTVNQSLIGIIVPRGVHEIMYEYKNPFYKTATILSFSLILLLILVVFILQMIRFRQDSWGLLYTASCIACLVVLPVILALKPVTSFEEVQEQNNEKITDSIDKMLEKEKHQEVFILFNTDSPQPFREEYPGENVIFRRFRFTADGIALWKMLDTLKTDKFLYVWSNVLEIPEMQDILQMHFPEITSRVAGKRYSVTLFSKDSLTQDDHRDTSDSTTVFSGRYAEKLTPLREFGSTFRYTFDQLPAKGIRVFATLRFLQIGDNGCHLVIAVNRKGRTLHYSAVDLGQFRSDKTSWSVGFASQQWLKSSLKKGDELLVYCWNSGKNEAVYVDDFLVQIRD